MPSPRLAGGTAVRSRPSSRIAPREGSRKPAIICSVVVFPQPDGPRKEMNSPLPTARLKSSTTVCGPNCFPTRSSSRKDMDGLPDAAVAEVDGGLRRRAAIARSRPLAPSVSSALDLAIPALGPFLALLVDDYPVGRIEFCRVLADRSHLAELRWNHDRLQYRAVAVVLQQHELDLRIEHHLDEARCERRGIGLGDRTGRCQQRGRAFLGINEVDGEAGVGEALHTACPPDGQHGWAGWKQLGNFAGGGFIAQQVGIDLSLEGLKAATNIAFAP